MKKIFLSKFALPFIFLWVILLEATVVTYEAQADYYHLDGTEGTYGSLRDYGGTVEGAYSTGNLFTEVWANTHEWGTIGDYKVYLMYSLILNADQPMSVTTDYGMFLEASVEPNPFGSWSFARGDITMYKQVGTHADGTGQYMYMQSDRKITGMTSTSADVDFYGSWTNLLQPGVPYFVELMSTVTMSWGYYSYAWAYTDPVHTVIDPNNTGATISLTLPEVYNNGSVFGPNYIPPETEPIPEPATMLLLGTGLVGVAGATRRKRKNQA